MRLKYDFVKLLENGVDGTLDQVEAEWDRASPSASCWPRNYPTPEKGESSRSAAGTASEDAHVFHAGTAGQHGQC